MTNTHARQATEQLVQALINLAARGLRKACLPLSGLRTI
jgi:hypothetical protein